MSSNCIKSTLKKYKSRNSPPYPANDCPNQIKHGNDGNKYISIEDKNGIFKWHLNNKPLISKSFDKYYIHDNGSRPFLVYVNNKHNNIIVHKINKNPDKYDRNI